MSMGVAVRITVILGPCYCRACETLVVWGTVTGMRGNSNKVRRWRDPDTGRIHRCPKEGE